jgi:hypothetical protein
MCRQVMCNRCKKITWSGCGQHVNQVMAGVPKENRCTCEAKAPAANGSGGGLLNRLFGR